MAWQADRWFCGCTPLPDPLHKPCAARPLWSNHLCPYGLSRQSDPIPPQLSSQAVWVTGTYINLKLQNKITCPFFCKSQFWRKEMLEESFL